MLKSLIYFMLKPLMYLLEGGPIGALVLIVAGIIIIFGIPLGVIEAMRRSKMTLWELQNEKDEREKRKMEFEMAEDIISVDKEWGAVSPAQICPHCQVRGRVRTMSVKRKKGVSGAKVTGAVLTAGVSILATGLSRKEGLTQAHCDNCNATWDY